MWNVKLANWDLATEGKRHLVLHAGDDFHQAFDWPACAEVNAACSQVTIRPCLDGVAVNQGKIVAEVNGGRSWRYRFQVGTPQVVMPVALPLFELMDVEVSLKGDDAIIHLPPMHKLPWPSKKSFSAFNRVGTAEVRAREALDARMLSAVASGKDNLVDNPIPGHVLAYLPRGAFLEARATAKALMGLAS